MEPQTRPPMDPIVEASEALSLNPHRRCFSFPCFPRTAAAAAAPVAEGESWWQRMRSWARGVDALMKIRLWSEILAGPRWKTFIRRLNRSRSGGPRHVSCQYDPLSYALNFDPGCGDLDEESGGGDYFSRNFTSRYAMGSLDLLKAAPGHPT